VIPAQRLKVGKLALRFCGHCWISCHHTGIPKLGVLDPERLRPSRIRHCFVKEVIAGVPPNSRVEQVI
jgi:hypothetical protein